jgi:RNA polymerase-binding transcription factor
MVQSQKLPRTRLLALKELLTHERTVTSTRVREYRAAQEQEALPPPSDELDTARALSDVETHASLIERAEDRLRAIDFAFNLLDQGRYGICAKCGEEIALERLKAVPFATYCVDCQQRRNRERHVGEGKIGEAFAAKWDLPEEMAESTETSRDEFIELPEEGPEEEEPRFSDLDLSPGAGTARAGWRRKAARPRPLKRSKRRH